MKNIAAYIALSLFFSSCSGNYSPNETQPSQIDSSEAIGGFQKESPSDSDYKKDLMSVEQTTEMPIKIQRKLIWTADLEFQVKNVDASTQKITKLSEKFDGFISDMELTSDSYQIANQITVRVANSKFHAFINAIKGESVFLDRANISSNDVTEEFVDIESRLKTKREVRDRYIKILRDKTGSISDVLEAEQAIRTITEEIEAKEGRLSFLKDRVDNSTVVMTIYEKVEYKDQPVRYEKGYGEEMGDSFTNGWEVITSAFLAIITIWPLLLILGIIYWRRKWIIKLFSGKF